MHLKRYTKILAFISGICFSLPAMEQVKINAENLQASATEIVNSLNRLPDGTPDTSDLPDAVNVILMQNIRITQDTIDMVLKWAQKLNADCSHNQLVEIDSILAPKLQQELKNPTEIMKHIIKQDEQHGEIRFKLVTWFLKNSESFFKLRDKIQLAWIFVLEEKNDDRWIDATLAELSHLLNKYLSCKFIEKNSPECAKNLGHVDYQLPIYFITENIPAKFYNRYDHLMSEMTSIIFNDIIDFSLSPTDPFNHQPYLEKLRKSTIRVKKASSLLKYAAPEWKELLEFSQIT